MSLAELVIVLDLLLKFAVVTADNDEDHNATLKAARLVAKKLVDSWGAEETIGRMTDLPF